MRRAIIRNEKKMRLKGGKVNMGQRRLVVLYAKAILSAALYLMNVVSYAEIKHARIDRSALDLAFFDLAEHVGKLREILSKIHEGG